MFTTCKKDSGWWNYHATFNECSFVGILVDGRTKKRMVIWQVSLPQARISLYPRTAGVSAKNYSWRAGARCKTWNDRKRHENWALLTLNIMAMTGYLGLRRKCRGRQDSQKAGGCFAWVLGWSLESQGIRWWWCFSFVRSAWPSYLCFFIVFRDMVSSFEKERWLMGGLSVKVVEVEFICISWAETMININDSEFGLEKNSFWNFSRARLIYLLYALLPKMRF